jgi:hypothetical protein
MGQGGNLTLVNGTKYDWVRTYQHAARMSTWEFPMRVAAGSSVSVYVEWEAGHFSPGSGSEGDVSYTLEGLPDAAHFQVQARSTTEFMLQLWLENLTTTNYAQGQTIPLGWDWNKNYSGGHVALVLAGASGSFLVSGPQSGAWLQNSLGLLGAQPLLHLCLPGAHDAGMSICVRETTGARPCNTITQAGSVGQQLQRGVRYFDIRPIIGGQQYRTGHYSKVLGWWQGGNGQDIDAIIDELNAYTTDHAELIILNLSHDLNTDLGAKSYAPFTQDEWNSLVEKLRKINHLFVRDTLDLSRLTLHDFIGHGQAAVVLIVEPGYVYLGADLGRGFYPYSSFSVYNAYADSNDLATMATDQLTKLRQIRAEPNSRPFLLSWTLTQSGYQATNCFSGLTASIRELASVANPQVYLQLPGACTPQSYPNIIYLDDVQDASPAALALAVATQALP